MSFRKKRFLTTLKNLFKPTKKKIILLVLLLIVAAVVVFFFTRNNAVQVMGGDLFGVRTVTLEKTSLRESVTVTGMVKSGSVANVTTSQLYQVSEVLVQVGDHVNVGDVICKLDTTDLEKELAKLQKNLSDNISSAQTNYDTAQDNLNTANEKLNTAYGVYLSAGAAFNAARNTQYMDAKASIASYQQAYDAALLEEQRAGAALNADASVVNAQSQVAVAQTALQAAEQALQAAPDDANLQSAVALAQADLATAQAALVAAQSVVQPLADAYAQATFARQNAETALNTAKNNSGFNELFSAYEAADNAFLQAQSSYENAQATQKSAQTSFDTAKENLEKASTSDDITDLREKIEDCVITATQAGTITALNATVGATANNSIIAVIQDTDDLKVSVTIDEDDIKKVAVGQRAVIFSDATGETEIAGEVSQLSLTSESAQGGASGFGAEITVQGLDSGLLVGLSAKVEIVFSEKTDVFTVPYDAVSQDENGNDVIYVRKGIDFEPVVITLGVENDYYVEISGAELQEGMEVRVSANDTAQNGTMDFSGGMMQGGIVMESEANTAQTVTVAPGGSMGGGPRGG